MPIAPTAWATNSPVTARSLNTNLYTYTPGNQHAPTGILFHTTPPLLTETMWAAPGFGQASSPTGADTETNYFAQDKWYNFGDTSALFSIGGDRVGAQGTGQYISRVPGSNGVGTATGGWHIIWGWACWGSQTNTGGAGSFIYQTNVNPGALVFGGYQRSTVTYRNNSYTLDLVNCGTVPYGYTIGGVCADASSSSFTIQYSSTYSGTTTRMGALWACNSAADQPVVYAVPTPQATWTAQTEVTSGLLNDSVTSTLQFLNYPPTFRGAEGLSTSIGANSSIAVDIGSGVSIDTHGGWDSGNSTYTVQVSGIYLVHAMCCVSSSGSGDFYAVVAVNGTRWYGPAYNATGGSSATTNPQMTRLLDLEAGDTLQLGCYSTVSTSLNSGHPCRLIIKWMAAIASSNSSVSWTAPDMWYRWEAGEAAANLPALFTSRIGNDLNFLINRPYFCGYQSTQQTGIAANTWVPVTCSATGPIHGSAGDNYGGWVSGSSNYYEAKVAGWYLCVLSVSQSVPSAATETTAGFGYYTSSGATQGSVSPDVYQQVTSTTTVSEPGAEAIFAYYLDVGDRIQPQYNQPAPSTSYSMANSTGHQPTFGMIWVSE